MFLLMKQQASIIDGAKNVNQNINCAKIKASTAQESTKLMPKDSDK